MKKLQRKRERNRKHEEKIIYEIEDLRSELKTSQDNLDHFIVLNWALRENLVVFIRYLQRNLTMRSHNSNRSRIYQATKLES